MRNRILTILLNNQDSFVSGEDISQELGVSRTAVWKNIGQLKETGFKIQSVSNKGYRLTSLVDKFEPALVQHYLTTKNFGRALEVHETISSTNSRAKELAQSGAAHGTLVVAERQSSGRGRLGRSWESPEGLGLWMSLILRPSFPPRFAPRMTVLAGLAVVQAISRITGLEAFIKWPNDIIINSKKLCGILTEMQADPDLIDYIVLGIGMNVNTQKEDFPIELRDSATSLKLEKGEHIDRCKLLAELLAVFEDLDNRYLKTGDFSEILNEYKEKCITLGRTVRVTGPTEAFEGTAVDLTDDFELIVETKSGESRKVFSGDVSVRGIAGYI
ncbi:MAG: biotin--[acetyl-CoA-carboxylase] ligase [Clostridiales bacterium]|nr:biotin--[acetyl-CoA-carboxylase] ligase [Clostridiales bacterium]